MADIPTPLPECAEWCPLSGSEYCPEDKEACPLRECPIGKEMRRAAEGTTPEQCPYRTED